MCRICLTCRTNKALPNNTVCAPCRDELKKQEALLVKRTTYERNLAKLQQEQAALFVR